MTPVSTSRILIRPAVPADLDDLLQLEKLSFARPWKRADLARELARPDGLVLLLKTALAAPAPAYLCARIISPEAELLRIAVAPAARRQGLGRRLLERLVTDLGRQKITTLHLEVAENNQPALHLYRQFGFTPAGQRPGYYDQCRTAALLLTKPC